RTGRTGNAITLMLGGRATTPLHDTPLQFPNWEGVNEQPCSCMWKTLLCRTAQLNDARTPSFQVPGSHPLLPKPRLFHTNVASTLPRPAKTATTLCQGRPLTCQGRPTYLPHTYPSASHVPIHPPRTQHARAVTLPPCLGRTPERLIRDPRAGGRVCRGRVREIDQWLEGY